MYYPSAVPMGDTTQGGSNVRFLSKTGKKIDAICPRPTYKHMVVTGETALRCIETQFEFLSVTIYARGRFSVALETPRVVPH